MKTVLILCSLVAVVCVSASSVVLAQDTNVAPQQAEIAVPPPPTSTVVVETGPSIPEPPAPTLSLSQPTMDAELAARVLALLQNRGTRARGEATLAGITSMALGVGVSILGGALVADDDTVLGERIGGTAMLGWIFLALGPTSVVQGISLLSMASSAEERAERYGRLLADGMSPEEYAAIGGELRADANAAHYQRMIATASLFGLAAGGAAVFVLAAAQNDLHDEVRTFGYAFGGTLTGLGLVGGLLMSFIKFPQERDYDAFEAGVPPDSLTASLRFAPLASSHGGGLAVSGAF